MIWCAKTHHRLENARELFGIKQAETDRYLVDPEMPTNPL